MGGTGDTVRKNKNWAHLTLAAQADELGSTDELPVEMDTEMPSRLFLSKLGNRMGIVLRGPSSGPAGCLREDGQQGNKSEPCGGADWFCDHKKTAWSQLLNYIIN